LCPALLVTTNADFFQNQSADEPVLEEIELQN